MSSITMEPMGTAAMVIVCQNPSMTHTPSCAAITTIPPDLGMPHFRDDEMPHTSIPKGLSVPLPHSRLQTKNMSSPVTPECVFAGGLSISPVSMLDI